MDHLFVKEILCHIGQAVCKKVHDSVKQQSSAQLANVVEEGLDDTIYQIDRDVEEVIVPLLKEIAAKVKGIVLIAEGIGDIDNPLVLPENTEEEAAAVRIIMDPIDGTRGIMYDKRPAFFLAGAALNKGRSTTLQDIEVAVMVELPVSKSIYSDTLWAIKGKGTYAARRNLMDSTTKEIPIQPSRSKSIYGGFAQVARFFPGGREVLAAIEEEMIEKLFPDAPRGKAILFEDQYISTGGQLYEMLMGHDRFIADIRGALFRKIAKEGKRTGMTCHPYDLCTMLIAMEAGIIITDIEDNAVKSVLDTVSSADWIAYANEAIRDEVAPALKLAMQKHGLV